jgi:hypothetical protein
MGVPRVDTHDRKSIRFSSCHSQLGMAPEPVRAACGAGLRITLASAPGSERGLLGTRSAVDYAHGGSFCDRSNPTYCCMAVLSVVADSEAEPIGPRLLGESSHPQLAMCIDKRNPAPAASAFATAARTSFRHVVLLPGAALHPPRGRLWEAGEVLLSGGPGRLVACTTCSRGGRGSAERSSPAWAETRAEARGSGARSMPAAH